MIRLGLLLMISSASLAEAESWKFDFGSGEPAEGFTAVRSGDRFSADKGYGFDWVGEPRDHPEFVTGDGGFYFSVAVPPGNYRVRLVLGDPVASSDTTVKAESRRLMIHSAKTPAGATATPGFSVNVRTPAIPGGGTVRLKEREKPYLHWDSKLTLEFNGPHPAVDSLEITAAPDVTTVFLLGDSTVTDQPYEPWNSWGQMLPRFFAESVAVANHAESGESVRSSLGARRFEQVYRTMKPGDHVFIQFGHNDMKDQRPDALETYRRDLVEAVGKVRELKGIPVLITSMERMAGVKNETLGDYPRTVREIAAAEEVPLIDLQQTSLILYRGLGDRLSSAFQDGTHHNNFGSDRLARCMVEGIRRELSELAVHLRPEVPPFDPAKPGLPSEFVLPESPLKDLAKPDGD